jgi:ABC-2 type transport system ATP-binding protein
LTVPARSVFGLLGPNGSGKSTLLSLLAGARSASSGTIRLLGEAPSNELRSRMGMVFQDGSLDPLMSVGETMRLHGRLFGMPRDALAARTTELLDRVGLAERVREPAAALSGGMRRRLELARALLPRPELLLLDEPTLALDPESRLALWDYLSEANREGCTLVLATNDVHEAERYCQTVALIAEGRLVAEGTPAALKRGLRREAVRITWRDDVAEPPDVAGWPGIGQVRWTAAGTHVTVDDASEFLARLFAQEGHSVGSVQTSESTLEDAYFQLVGRGIGRGAGEDA